jgi:hypothetical protein
VSNGSLENGGLQQVLVEKSTQPKERKEKIGGMRAKSL